MERKSLFPFRAAVTQNPLVPTWWDPQQAAQLANLLQQAEACLEAGNPLGAVEHWRAALTGLPDLPGPRKQWLRTRIRETLLAEASRAAGAGTDGFSAAERCLQLLVQTKVADGLSLKYLGLVVHCDGHPLQALEHYQRALSELPGDEDLAYAVRLARLQLAVPERRGLGGPAHPGREAAPRERGFPSDNPQGLERARTAARGRLAALERLLLQGDVPGALQKFPNPDDPGLAGEWALEGALLAILAHDWPLALRYFQAAQDRDWPPVLEPHASLYQATLLQLARAEEREVPQELRAEAHRLLREQPKSPPSPGYDALTGMRAHRQQFAAWQRYDRLIQLHEAIAAGAWNDAPRILAEALSWPADWPPNQAALRIWLACHDNDGTTARQLLLEAMGRGEGSVHPNLLRLSAWVAEHMGPPQEVVEQLNRLLDQFPRDDWGLERWKYWMLRLGRAAMAKAHFQQALLHFASLLLRLPEDADGWLWCARANEQLGNRQRAKECYRQARRYQKAPDQDTGREESAEAIRTRAAGRLLELLLAEDLLSPLPAPPFPFPEQQLRDLLTASVEGCDLYLLTLLRAWAAGHPSSSAFKAG